MRIGFSAAWPRGWREGNQNAVSCAVGRQVPQVWRSMVAIARVYVVVLCFCFCFCLVVLIVGDLYRAWRYTNCPFPVRSPPEDGSLQAPHPPPLCPPHWPVSSFV